MHFQSRAEYEKAIHYAKRCILAGFNAPGLISTIEPQRGMKLLIVKMNNKPESLLKDTFPDYLFTT
ncbi:MAG: hypothetical protein BV456_10765 [Thermoplasmata archaeon M8B2D]|nr:MAG: hypothetical protein BV456_10765 [Thermoplasmata archaeon M8B2D]